LFFSKEQIVKRHYHLELNCPSCSADGEAVFVAVSDPPQRIFCADCLMERMEVVEMTIVRCNVVTDDDGVDLFHAINNQRSTLQ
jgi:hypothetical protein